MRIVVVGLGSMGKRRVRNLRALGVSDIGGVDVREDRRREAAERYGIQTAERLESALQQKTDAVVISLPPDLHVAWALEAIRAGCPFFTEASVVLEGMRELREASRRAGVLGVPSCTMRYYWGPRRLRKVVGDGAIGQPWTWIYHSGQYLPDWHPWEPILSYYVSKRATGACREIVPFEMVWLTDLFGPVDAVMADLAKRSNLPADIDDVYQLMVRHASGVRGLLMVDVLARSPVRQIRILGSEGVAEWDAGPKRLRVYSAATKQWTEEVEGRQTVEAGYVNPEEPYVEEMADFLRCVREGCAPPYTLDDDIRNLEILAAAEESHRRGASVRVSPSPTMPPDRKAPGEGQRLRERAHRLIPGGCHTYSKGDDQFPRNAPPLLVGGKGCRVWDPDGREYLDWGMGLRSVILGHAFEPVLEAVRRELQSGSNFTRPSPREGELAEVLTELIPCAEMAKFAKNGSDVTSAAVRLSRAYTGRELIARCGDHPFFSVDDWFIGDTERNAGIPKRIREMTLRFSYNDADSLERLFREHPGLIACVILEPATTSEPRDGFLSRVRALCDREGAVLIFDEIITGFRWHVRGGQSLFGVTPDLATFGKAMANGFSVSALVGKREIMKRGGTDHEHPLVFLLSTTAGGETHALAAALATVRYLRGNPVLDHVWKIGRQLRDGFNRLAAEAGLERHALARGYPCSPEFAFLDAQGPALPLRTLFQQEMAARGVLMPYLVPSFAHTEADVERTLGACREALDVVRRAVDRGSVEGLLEGPVIRPVFRRLSG